MPSFTDVYTGYPLVYLRFALGLPFVNLSIPKECIVYYTRGLPQVYLNFMYLISLFFVINKLMNV